MFGHHFYLPNHLRSARLTQAELTENFRCVLFIGNGVMLTSVSMVFITVFIGYLVPQWFSMIIQIISHIGLILFAALLKIGYVMRLIGQNGLQCQLGLQVTKR